jgi:CRP/FNR family transcriptional regulator, cyclic AMP receptor protein
VSRTRSKSASPASDRTRQLSGRGFAGALDEHARVALESLGHVHRYRNGAAVFTEGDRTSDVALVLTGRLRIVCATEAGGQVTLAIREPGDLVGELAAIDGPGTPRNASAIAVGPTTARLIRAVEFTDFLVAHPTSSLALIRTLTGRLRDAERRRVEYGSIDATRRLARLLVELAGPPDDRGRATIDGSHSQNELASLIGASRESVARALVRLRQLELVDTGRRSVVVHDLEQLERFAR